MDTWEYFSKEHSSINPERRLKSPDEYNVTTGVVMEFFWHGQDDVIQKHSKKVDAILYKGKMAVSEAQLGLNGSSGVHKADI